MHCRDAQLRHPIGLRGSGIDSRRRTDRRKDNEQPGTARQCALPLLIGASPSGTPVAAARVTQYAARADPDTPSGRRRDGRQPALGKITRSSHAGGQLLRRTAGEPPAASLATPSAKTVLLNNRVQETGSVPPWGFASPAGTRLCTPEHSDGHGPSYPASNEPIAAQTHACRSYRDRSGCPTTASPRSLSPSRSRLLCAV